MRATFSDRVERGRVRTGDYASARGDDFGFFHLTTNAGAALGVMVSSGSDAIPWEHVSVSLKSRCPTWEEMSWVKLLFWGDDEDVVQFHPRRSEHVNFHPFCLHMWKPKAFALELPPSIAVGPKHARMVAR